MKHEATIHQIDARRAVSGAHRQLDALSRVVGEEVSAPPERQPGKLLLWYGGEWVQYEEFTEDEGEYGRSRYPAGAYMQTIALDASTITEPKYIADATLRINQCFDDSEFTLRLATGMYDTSYVTEGQAYEVLMATGEYGKSGHWPSLYDWENDTYEWLLPPEELGAAIATCVDSEWIPEIVDRLRQLEAISE